MPLPLVPRSATHTQLFWRIYIFVFYVCARSERVLIQSVSSLPMVRANIAAGCRACEGAQRGVATPPPVDHSIPSL